jgi:hypothetical protein
VRGQSGRANREELERRRVEAQRLRIRGLTYTQIARELAVDVATIRRDFEAIRMANRERLHALTPQDLAAQCEETYNELERRLWAEYESAPENSRHRLNALDLLRLTVNDRVRCLRDCGLIGESDATLRRADGRPGYELDFQLSADERAFLAEQLIQRALVRELPGPVPEPDDNVELFLNAPERGS